MFKLASFVILAVISLVGTLYLEQELTHYVAWEMLGMLALIFVALVAVIGTWLRAKWAWIASSLFFIASAANLTLIIISIQEAMLQYLVLMLINVLGFVLSITQAGQSSAKSIEQYASVEPVELDNIMPEPEQEYKVEFVKPKAAKSKRRK